MKEREINIAVTTETLVRALVIVFFALLLFKLAHLVLILLMAVVIAAAVEPATRWFARHKVSRIPSVLFIYVASFLALGAMLFIFVPTALSELSEVSKTLPKKVSWLGPSFNSQATALSRLTGNLGSDFNLDTVFSSLATTQTGNLLGFVSFIFGGIFSFILIMVISFYLAVQERGVENFLRVISPINVEAYLIDVWKRTEAKIGRWMQGQLLLGLIVGILVYIGLIILKIKYALSLALLAAVFELIPFFGPILAAVPAVLIAFGVSIPKGLLVIGFYIIIQQLENHLIYPLVVKKVIGIPPLIVILALLAGGQLAGFFGLILAVPAAVLLMEILNDFEKRKQREMAKVE